MAISFLLLFAVPGCFSCHARIVPRNRAKVVEDYVVSANFDSNSNFAQLNDRSQPREIYQEGETRRRQETAGVFLFAPPSSHSGNHREAPDHDHEGALEERDFLVHHHHIPHAPHPPPPPPPPVGLPYASSMFAVGLITFLMLLNSLQSSLLVVKASKGTLLGSPLGPLTGIVGRRKRFASENVEELLEKYEKANPDSTERPTSV